MRIWDVEPYHLCRKHLLAEHRELHGLWNILTKHEGKGGYSHHPETLRWVGNTKALYNRHAKLVEEFARRGFNHKTPLDAKLASGVEVQLHFVNSLLEQRTILRGKGCECFVTDK